MNIIANNRQEHMVKIPKSELNILKLRGRERTDFRNQLEYAYEDLKMQGAVVKELDSTVKELKREVRILSDENSEIMDIMERNQSGRRDISSLMQTMRGMVKKEKKRSIYGSDPEAKRRRIATTMYDDASDAMECGDNLMYLFMKCEEAAWRTDVEEVIHYGKLVKKTIDDQRTFEKLHCKGGWYDWHPSWKDWKERNKHNWIHRKCAMQLHPTNDEMERWARKMNRETPKTNRSP